MFAGAKLYLILQAVTAIPFTVLIITPESELTTAARWLGGTLLWMQIVNWGGVLEARKWAWLSELARLGLTAAFLAWNFPVVQTNLFGVGFFLFSVLSLLWVIIYFRPNSRVVPAPA